MREIKVEIAFDLDNDKALTSLSRLLGFVEGELGMYDLRDSVVAGLHTVVDQHEVQKFLDSL